jgi:hypothetical protein
VTRAVWIRQTYLRLRDAGHPVVLSVTPPDRGIVVVEATARRRLFVAGLDPHVLLVAVRADHRPQRYAEVEVVQNVRCRPSTACSSARDIAFSDGCRAPRPRGSAPEIDRPRGARVGSASNPDASPGTARSGSGRSNPCLDRSPV